jgi:hypothetical protein
MADWVQTRKFMTKFADANGYMLLCFSEVLAIVPYLLRSLRIQKMFEAREIYCNTDVMPKTMIWKWREARIIRIFMIIVVVNSIVYTSLGFLQDYGYSPINMPNYYTISSAMSTNGKISKVAMTSDIGLTNCFISAMSFVEYVLLCWALNAQWQIEEEYNIFVELFFVTLVWGMCNTMINYAWVIDDRIVNKNF